MHRAWFVSLLLATTPFACGDDTEATTTTRAGGGSSASSATATAAASSSTGTGGAGGDGGAAIGGSSGESCTECVGPLLGGTGRCGPLHQACSDDGDCQGWLTCYDVTCLQGDFSVACFDACDRQYADAAKLYQPFLTCWCNACAAACQPLCR
jgi:hypothetical protein